MRKQLYKVLDGLRSPYQTNFVYEIGKEYYCEDFDIDESIDCSRGFYAVDIDGLPFAFRVGRDVYRCEVWGRSVEYNEFKRRYSHIKLIERVDYDFIKQEAKKIERAVGYKLQEALFPINPLHRKRKPTKQDIENVLKWASVGASVRDSVRDSVWDSVWASVGASVGASVWDSVWASVRAYISSLFPNIEKWEYIEHEKGKNPFQPCIDLWHRGFVPSYDGKVWRLHSGKNADVVWTSEQGGEDGKIP